MVTGRDDDHGVCDTDDGDGVGGNHVAEEDGEGGGGEEGGGGGGWC